MPDRVPPENSHTVLPTDSLMPGGVQMASAGFWANVGFNLAETENVYIKIVVTPGRHPTSGVWSTFEKPGRTLGDL